MAERNGAASAAAAPPQIGPDGVPLWRANGAPAQHRRVLAPPGVSFEDANGELRAKWDSMGSSSGASYAAQLLRARLPAAFLARDPLASHAWIYAAAAITAITGSQSPFTVMRETSKAMAMRRQKALDDGVTNFRPRSGFDRTAARRWLRGGFQQRLFWRSAGAEPVEDHPIQRLLEAPNPFQDGTQLFFTTLLWLAYRFQAFWVCTDDAGKPTSYANDPTRIYPISPDCFEPRFSTPSGGEFIGWWYRPPHFVPGGGLGAKIFLMPDEVIRFAMSNPVDLSGALAPLVPLTNQIELDISLGKYVRALIANQAVPKGVVEYDGSLSKDEESDYRGRWKENFEGEENAGRTAFLHSGFHYNTVALAPSEWQNVDLQKWHREAELAVMRTPPSVLGVTEFTNYATALGQGKGFYDKAILPFFRVIESKLDATLFFPTTDNLFGAFDVSEVEALRAGVAEKLTMAAGMCGFELHADPRTAYEVVGLQVPKYLADDVALISRIGATVEDVISGNLAPISGTPGAPAGPGVGGGGGTSGTDPGAPGDKTPAENPPKENPPPEKAPPTGGGGPGKSIAIATRKAIGGRRWADFIAFEAREEGSMADAYRSWATAERRATLARFDDLAKSRGRIVRSSINLGAVLPDPFESKNALKAKSRPTYSDTLETTYNFTLDDIGIPTFPIDAESILSYFDLRESVFVENTTQSIFNNLRNSLTEGIQSGETIQQLRLRIAEVYDIAVGTPKTLMVARTEVSGFVNGVRDKMFDEQGFSLEEWISANDERTRDDHLLFGGEGPLPRGTNYLSLDGVTGDASGVLEFPGDSRAGPGQVINCRCLKVPIE